MRISVRLLREFIRENIGSMFGLDRYVTVNALSDVVGGPDPFLGPAGQDMRLNHPDIPQVDAMLRLSGNPIHELDEFQGQPDVTDELALFPDPQADD